MIPRFHCPFPLAPGAQVELPERAAHHAIRVLRMQPGDSIVLFDGRGGEWLAEIVGAGRTVRAALRAYDNRDCESPLHITLVQALPSGDKMDWIVEKCVELGVAAIQPVAAKRSVVRLSAERMTKRVAHWNAIASAACEQCGRNRVPLVAPVLDLPRYLAEAMTPPTLAHAHLQGLELPRQAYSTPRARRLLLAPAGDIPLRSLNPPTEPVVIMVGPEGGWEEGELQAAQVAGFTTVRLGPRVLRTETAGAAVLAAMQAVWGDF